MQREVAPRGLWGRTWPALLAVSTVGAVGVPAAVASYRHAHDVIALNGDPVMAPWLPLSVDGMLVAALVVIWVRRHRGDRAGAFPWLAFGFGMVVTILANLAAVAEPKPEAVAVALFPPLALAITLELVALIAYRSGRSHTTDGQAADSVALDSDEPIVIGYLNEVDEHDPGSPDWWAGAPVTTDAVDDVDGQTGDDDPVSDQHRTAQDRDTAEAGRVADSRVQGLARRLGAGEELTGRAVGDEFGVSARTGRRLIRQAADLQRCGSRDTASLALASAGGGS
ncbi:DUF2637 domain-containing protein [Streptomyces sp. NPDC048558]|uniref:DUF2637 domain-containing protein n=1 Tax=Actinomycetes TaxID=1760 RepID=UPI003443C010